MNLKALKEKVEVIDQRIWTGETVQIDLNENGKLLQLIVNSEGANKVNGALESSFAESNVQTFNLEVNFADFSRDEVDQLITESKSLETLEARELERAADVPDVILRRPADMWILYQDCSYKTSSGYTLTALEGYETDLASVPRIFWALLSSFELSLAAPLFHDLIYRCEGDLPVGQIQPFDGKKFERREADYIFLELMEKAGVKKWKREVAYRAVRYFAGFAWRKNNPIIS